MLWTSSISPTYSANLSFRLPVLFPITIRRTPTSLRPLSPTSKRRLLYNLSPFLRKEYDAARIDARMEKLHNPSGRQGYGKRHKEAHTRTNVTDCTPEQVLTFEARALLQKLEPDGSNEEPQNGEMDLEGRKYASRSGKSEAYGEIELDIQELSSTGDGLAYSPSTSDRFIYVVPFAVPGDKVLAKTYPQKSPSPRQPWMKADFLKLLSPSPSREGVTPKCPYFESCGGCQFQMLPYEAQLAHKKTIVEKAFKYFSNLDPSLIPAVEDTIGSPMQYGYRTKLTPHYDECGKKNAWYPGDPTPPFGFKKKNGPKVMDIEQCIIGTEILNEGLKIERTKLKDTFWRKKTGSSILLRENTQREMISMDDDDTNSAKSIEFITGDTDSTSPIPDLSSLSLTYPGTPSSTALTFPTPTTPQITYTYPSSHFRDIKSYTSNTAAFTTEHIGPYTFTTRANSFFQNNNSILPTFLSYVRANILPQPSSTPFSSSAPSPPKIKYLLDAYCGSGLFSIALASEFSSVLGIDIDALSISCARTNATLNSSFPSVTSAIPKRGNLGFIAADAQALFQDVPFPPPRHYASSTHLGKAHPSIFSARCVSLDRSV